MHEVSEGRRSEMTGTRYIIVSPTGTGLSIALWRLWGVGDGREVEWDRVTGWAGMGVGVVDLTWYLGEPERGGKSQTYSVFRQRT